MSDRLVFDDFKEKYRMGTKGSAVFGGPFEMEIVLDFTGQRGSGPNIYYSYVYQLPKWDYKLKKVDEWISVTPTFAEYYNLTIEQKAKIEAAIKQGLGGAAQSVTDYELIAHDARRYREMLDYFKQATGKDSHVLRNLFVDRVDAHTGDYGLITMARRWPSIISDFIRMDESLADVDKIMKELEVSRAEANILKTKNELYKEWKALFLPAVKERYARIMTLMNARKKSIEEYRKWLRPYIARYKMIREKEEDKPAEFLSNPYMTPGFGQSQASAGIRLWAWRHFAPAEKMGMEATKFKKGGEKSKFIIDPYDDFVKEWQQKIEEMYKVKFSEEKIRKIIDKAVENKEMLPHFLYYVLVDLKIQLNLTKTPPPQGTELDNLIFQPFKLWVISQNVLLILMLEISAREEAFERNINELIGSKEHEEDMLRQIEEEFKPKESEKMQGLKKFVSRTRWLGNISKKALEGIFYIFVRRGPYETAWEERITKMYFRASGGHYKQHIDHIMKAMKVD